MKKIHYLLLILLLSLSGVTLFSLTTNACGGLFCSSVAPQPVDQTSEKIIFEVGGGQITAHVLIQYTGTADDFAWVVPVPEVPTVGETPIQAFSDIDTATTLTPQLPAPNPCQFNDDSSFMACSDSSKGMSTSSRSDYSNNDNVVVYAHDYTNNYEYAVVGAENTGDLIDWLNDNDYTVGSNMTPVMDVYNMPGMKFLAIKLREGRSASDITPLNFSFAGNEPMIPIQLTAVAAQPLMGILVFIIADSPYVPKNYDFSEPDEDAILFDRNRNTNYFSWVAKTTAEHDGRFFSREFSGPSPLAATTGITLDNKIISRYYTRVNPHQMTTDPMFMRMSSAADYNGLIDLSSHDTLWNCNDVITQREPSPCAFNFCGLDATCYEVDDQFACKCPTGQTAQSYTGPDGLAHVTCMPSENPFGNPPEIFGAGTSADPCNRLACGEGECILRGGFPTCQCASGFAAITTLDGPSCVDISNGTIAFGTGGDMQSRGAKTPDPAPNRYAFPPFLWVVLAMLTIGLMRRR